MNHENRASDILLAKLEVVVEELKRDFEEHLTIERHWQDRITASLDEISSQLTRYKGVIGGVTLVLGLLWAGIQLFKDQLLSFFGK